MYNRYHPHLHHHFHPRNIFVFLYRHRFHIFVLGVLMIIIECGYKKYKSINEVSSPIIEEIQLVKINSISNNLESITLNSGTEYICKFTLECESMSDDEGLFTVRLLVNKEKADFVFNSADTTIYEISDNFIDYSFSNSLSEDDLKIVTFSILLIPIEDCKVSDICWTTTISNCIME